jgi:WD40 repeat protein
MAMLRKDDILKLIFRYQGLVERNRMFGDMFNHTLFNIILQVDRSVGLIGSIEFGKHRTILSILSDGCLIMGSEYQVGIWDGHRLTKEFKNESNMNVGLITSILGLRNNDIVVGGIRGLLRVWFNNSGYEDFRTLEGHTRGVLCLSMMLKGLFASGTREQIIIWDTNDDFNKLHRFEKDGQGGMLSIVQLFNMDIVSSTETEVTVYKYDTDFKDLVILENSSPCRLLALRDGRLASGNHDQKIHIFDPYNGYKCIYDVNCEFEPMYMGLLTSGNMITASPLDKIIRISI